MSTTPLPVNNINPNYRVRLNGTNELNQQIDVIGALPEKFGLHVGSSWESLFGDGGHVGDALGTISRAGGNALNGATDLARRFTGFSGQTQLLSQLIWKTSSPIELTIPFQFNTISDVQGELIYPLKNLLKLVLPSLYNPAAGLANAGLGGTDDTITSKAIMALRGYLGNAASTAIGDLGLLRGPGPSPSIAGSLLGTGSSNPYNLTLHIGKYWKFPNIIALDARADMDNLFTQNGDYISCEVEMRFSTSSIVTKDQIDQMIPDAGGSTTTSTNATSTLFSSGAFA